VRVIWPSRATPESVLAQLLMRVRAPYCLSRDVPSSVSNHRVDVVVHSVRHSAASHLRRATEGWQGAVNAGPPPLPRPEPGEAVEVDRVVSRAGTVSLAYRVVLAAEILAGRQVGVRIEPELLMFFDLTTRELLRTRPNPLTPAQMRRVRGARRAGPPPGPSTEPIRVQRRASNIGVIMVAG
jgi:hypothetical protein